MKNKTWIICSFLLIVILFVIQVLFIINQAWVADYWEHKAVFNELYRHPFNPGHPLVNIKAPHAFFSPYMVGIALLARILSIAPSVALNAITLINLALLIFSVWLLGRLFFTKQYPFKSFFLLLLLFLFYWGVYPPYYSGFYHFIALPYVITYPATFSFSMSVFSVYLLKYFLYGKMGRNKKYLIFLLILSFNWMIVLSHPLTFLFCISLYLFFFSKKILTFQEWGKGSWMQGVYYLSITALLFVLPVCFAFLWPYFSLFDLLTKVSQNSRFHTDSKVLYFSLAKEYFPFAFPLLFLVFKIIQKQKDAFPFFISIIFLVCVYLYGYFTKSYGLGRMISFIAVLLQIWLLWSILTIQNTRKLIISSSVVMLLVVPFLISSIKITVSTALLTHSDYLHRKTADPFELSTPTTIITHRLLFIESIIGNDNLILSDPVCSRYIPGLGGKVIASSYADYWIADNENRLDELKRFFYGTDSLYRVTMLKKYKPVFLLLTPSTVHILPELQSYYEKGGVVYKNGIQLIKLKYDAAE